MITGWIISAVVALVRSILSVLPSWDFGSLNISGFGDLAGTTAVVLEGWFPLDTLVICIGVLLGVHLAQSMWNALVWLYHQFWGAS